jgi:hypothetical protein
LGSTARAVDTTPSAMATRMTRVTGLRRHPLHVAARYVPLRPSQPYGAWVRPTMAP